MIHEQEQGLGTAVAALRRLADYHLPPALDQRLLELSERKEELTTQEHEELQAWVQFSQERTLEKLAAQAALGRLQRDFAMPNC